MLSIANKYLDKMNRQVANGQKSFILSMKQKQVLMAILSCEFIEIRTLLTHQTIVKMFQFVASCRQHPGPINSSYEIEF